MFDYIRTSSCNEQFAVNIVRLKVYITFSPFDGLALLPRSQLRVKPDKCYVCTIMATGQYLSYGIQTWHDVRLMYGISPFDELRVDLRSQWVDKGTTLVLNYFDN